MASSGVRKINELTIQDGRALIITEETEQNYAWDDIPNGSLKVNGTTGLIMVKIAGQSNWIPSNVKLDIVRDQEGRICDLAGNVVTDAEYLRLVEQAVSQGGHTLSIAKDAMIVKETFTIESTYLAEKKFSYRDNTGQRYFGDQTEDGFWFELKKGHYAPGRNMLEVIIDDCLYRSAATGGVVEVSETKFYMTEELVPGMELTVTYYQLNKIGNPYPRIYLRRGDYTINEDGYETLTGNDDLYQPESAEIGDIWFDYNGNVDDKDAFLGEDPTDPLGKISFDRISGIPGTVDAAVAKGLMVDAAKKNHKHTMDDITDMSAATSQIISHVMEASSIASVASAQKAEEADDAKLLQGKTVGNKPRNIVMVQRDGYVSDGIISPNLKKIKNMLDYDEFLETVRSLVSNYFVKGMIVAWYGEEANVPEGWHICDGTGGTPDLRDRFIMGASSKHSHRLPVDAGLPNIEGEFGGNAQAVPNPTGAFSQEELGMGFQGVHYDQTGMKILFSARSNNTIYGNSETVQPPAIAMHYIMKM